MGTQTMQALMMPVQCKQCGQLFDLSYDLEKEMDSMQEKVMAAKGRKAKALLCWECR